MVRGGLLPGEDIQYEFWTGVREREDSYITVEHPIESGVIKLNIHTQKRRKRNIIFG